MYSSYNKSVVIGHTEVLAKAYRLNFQSLWVVTSLGKKRQIKNI